MIMCFRGLLICTSHKAFESHEISLPAFDWYYEQQFWVLILQTVYFTYSVYSVVLAKRATMWLRLRDTMLTNHLYVSPQCTRHALMIKPLSQLNNGDLFITLFSFSPPLLSPSLSRSFLSLSHRHTHTQIFGSLYHIYCPVISSFAPYCMNGTIDKVKIFRK